MLSHKNDVGKLILDEIKTLYPQIKTCTFAESDIYNNANSNSQKVQIVVFKTEGRNLFIAEKKKITNWLKARLKSDKLKIFFEN